jgi:hypothetical protein
MAVAGRYQLMVKSSMSARTVMVSMTRSGLASQREKKNSTPPVSISVEPNYFDSPGTKTLPELNYGRQPLRLDLKPR